jgi:polysaccharide biosynthesis protein PslG
MPTALPSPSPTPGPLLSSPDYGIQAFLWWRPEVASRDLGLIKDMGFRWVKQVFAWSDIEGAQKGHYNWAQADNVVRMAEEAGIKLLARVDRAPAWTGAQEPNGPPTNYADFGDFCYALASRYKGKIQAYEIWNEPNLAREWGGKPPSPQEYTRLLAIAYQRIKEADPDALVISAGLTPTGTSSNEAMPDTQYLEGMYQAGFQAYCDMVGVHAAGFKAAPEISPEEAATAKDGQGSFLYGGERFFCFRHVEDLRQIMEQRGDGDRRVAILEFGWTSDTIHPSYAWHAVSEEQKADYMVRAYVYAKEHWRPWIALMSLIYIADSDWTDDREEAWWAITAPGYPTPQLRPAYYALRDMPKD